MIKYSFTGIGPERIPDQEVTETQWICGDMKSGRWTMMA
jgi:hypothetical protein